MICISISHDMRQIRHDRINETFWEFTDSGMVVLQQKKNTEITTTLEAVLFATRFFNRLILFYSYPIL